MLLQPYNTIPLTAGTPMQLQAPSGGYFVQILNLGPGNLFLKNDDTVAAGDPASYELPINLSISPLVRGSVWVVPDAAGSISVALIPRQ